MAPSMYLRLVGLVLLGAGVAVAIRTNRGQSSVDEPAVQEESAVPGMSIEDAHKALTDSLMREAAWPLAAGDERILCVMPLFHVFASSVCLHPAVYCRGTMVILPRFHPAAVLGLGATVRTTAREIAGEDFFTAMFETALEDGELITEVAFPVPEAACYVKFPNPASRYAIVGVMVARTSAGGGGGVRVAVTGAGANAFRATAMEQALAANFSAQALDGVAVPADDLNADIHASAEYRAHLVTVMAKRAVAAAG